MERQQLVELARIGAKERLVELGKEERQLRRLIGERLDGHRPVMARATIRPHVQSPAQRRATSMRMKAYWAARRRQARRKSA